MLNATEKSEFLWGVQLLSIMNLDSITGLLSATETEEGRQIHELQGHKLIMFYYLEED